MRYSSRFAMLSLMLAAAVPVQAQRSDAVVDSLPAAVGTAAAPAEPRAENAAHGAALTGLRAGVHLRETTRSAQPTAAPAHANLGQSRALMIVGVAALIAGGIVGGDAGHIIMVTGAIVGLYGLYTYLQ